VSSGPVPGGGSSPIDVVVVVKAAVVVVGLPVPSQSGHQLGHGARSGGEIHSQIGYQPSSNQNEQRRGLKLGLKTVPQAQGLESYKIVNFH
jgi:hypothetical protein